MHKQFTSTYVNTCCYDKQNKLTTVVIINYCTCTYTTCTCVYVYAMKYN